MPLPVLSQVTGFEWDAGNARKNEKHGVSWEEAEQVFEHRPEVVEDLKHSGREDRFHAFGRTTEGRQLQVAFTMRKNGTVVRIISARPMSRNERESYAKAEENPGPDPQVQN